MSLPRAAWPMISSTEQVSFSAKWQKLSYSRVSCIFILPFRCCHTKPSKLSPRQPDFRWSNCWNLILIEWSWIIILATQDLRIGASCFWRARGKALRWKMGAGGFILQSLLHLALLSTGKPIAWLKGYSESTHKVLQSLDVSQARINTWNSTWLDKSLWTWRKTRSKCISGIYWFNSQSVLGCKYIPVCGIPVGPRWDELEVGCGGCHVQQTLVSELFHDNG